MGVGKKNVGKNEFSVAGDKTFIKSLIYCLFSVGKDGLSIAAEDGGKKAEKKAKKGKKGLTNPRRKLRTGKSLYP